MSNMHTRLSVPNVVSRDFIAGIEIRTLMESRVTGNCANGPVKVIKLLSRLIDYPHSPL